MLGRPKINAAAPFRASVADAAFAVEERVVWGGADLLRRLAEAVKWPLERAVWTVERGVVWPIEERTDGWSGSARAASAGGLALLAVGAAVLGLVIASGGGSATQAVEVSAPVVKSVPSTAPAKPAPTLRGPTPDFKTADPNAGSKLAGEATAKTKEKGGAEASSTTVAQGTTPESSPSATATPVDTAPPAATAVAHRFAGAFVLYEVGKDTPKVHATITATATPRLARALLKRPPRLPANTEVPKAKVLNVVPGPKQGDTYTMSVSLLRLGITSELRIDMKQEKRSGDWRVAHIDG